MVGLRCGFRCAPKQAHGGCGHLEGDEALGWKVASGYSTHPWGLDRQAPSKTSGCQTCIPESSQELHLHTRCGKPSAAAEEGAWAQGGFSGCGVDVLYAPSLPPQSAQRVLPPFRNALVWGHQHPSQTLCFLLPLRPELCGTRGPQQEWRRSLRGRAAPRPQVLRMSLPQSLPEKDLGHLPVLWVDLCWGPNKMLQPSPPVPVNVAKGSLQMTKFR